MDRLYFLHQLWRVMRDSPGLIFDLGFLLMMKNFWMIEGYQLYRLELHLKNLENVKIQIQKSLGKT